MIDESIIFYYTSGMLWRAIARAKLMPIRSPYKCWRKMVYQTHITLVKFSKFLVEGGLIFI